MRILLCEANISEGRRAAVLAAIAAAIRGVRGARLVDHSADPDHNRAVFSFLGAPDRVLEGAMAMAETALARVDMTEHRGAHPRLGVLDVVPFVPVRGVGMDEAVRTAREFGRFLGQRGVPVYFYEEAAMRPERRSLPEVRRGGYEGLAARLADPEWSPDAGPAELDPRIGAAVVGARGPLVRFNVNLRTSDVGVAREIAACMRERDGGLPGVRALGFALAGRGLSQVSFNITDYTKTGIDRVLAGVREEAARRGVAIEGTEVIGLVPLAALQPLVRDSLDAREFRTGQVLEAVLLG